MNKIGFYDDVRSDLTNRDKFLFCPACYSVFRRETRKYDVDSINIIKRIEGDNCPYCKVITLEGYQYG